MIDIDVENIFAFFVVTESTDSTGSNGANRLLSSHLDPLCGEVASLPSGPVSYGLILLVPLSLRAFSSLLPVSTMSDEAAAAAAKAVADADAAGVARATALFSKTYDGARPTAAAAAPGRVNLIGEHTDYNDGWVFPLALEKSTYMVGARRSGGAGTKSRIVCEAFEGDVVEFDVAGDVAPLSGDRKWANYVVGMVAMYVRAVEKAGGEGIPAFDAAFVSDVPIGGGVSSSAALEVCIVGLTSERVAYRG